VPDNGCRPLVEGAAHGEGAPVEDVGVNHRCGYVAVAQELLDGPDVVTCLEEVGGESVPERVAGGGFEEVCGLAGGAERTLKHCFVKVMAPELAVGGTVVASCREDPLPRPFALRKRVLMSECARKLDVARARSGPRRELGRSVTRSRLPLPFRMTRWPALKSTSLTRNRAHSSRRSPEPYSKPAMSAGTPDMRLMTARTSSLESTRGNRCL